MKVFLFIMTCLFFPLGTQAKTPVIYSVGQGLPMKKDEKVTKNYYIDIGRKHGLRVGSLLKIQRRIFRDGLHKNQEAHQYQIPLGKLRAVHVEDDVSVAVLETFLPQEELYVEIQAPMVGDLVSVDVD